MAFDYSSNRFFLRLNILTIGARGGKGCSCHDGQETERKEESRQQVYPSKEEALPTPSETLSSRGLTSWSSYAHPNGSTIEGGVQIPFVFKSGEFGLPSFIFIFFIWNLKWQDNKLLVEWLAAHWLNLSWVENYKWRCNRQWRAAIL